MSNPMEKDLPASSRGIYSPEGALDDSNKGFSIRAKVLAVGMGREKSLPQKLIDFAEESTQSVEDPFNLVQSPIDPETEDGIGYYPDTAKEPRKILTAGGMMVPGFIKDGLGDSVIESYGEKIQLSSMYGQAGENRAPILNRKQRRALAKRSRKSTKR